MIAACLIVKDEAHVIEKCLKGIRPFVDGIFVYDTGSTDGTQEIAAKYATVEQGEWRDDFAWARNQSFRMPPPEYTWLTWFDADDRIEGGNWLRKLSLGNDAAPIDGFVCDYRTKIGNQRQTLQAVRIIRRSAGYQWRYPLHEQLMAPVPEEARLVAMRKPTWFHTEPDLDKRKTSARRNYRIIGRNTDTAHEFLTPDQLRIFYKELAGGSFPYGLD